MKKCYCSKWEENIDNGIQLIINDIIKCPYCGKDLEDTEMKCDFCLKNYEDPWEIQEFLIIDKVGGYASIFGDGERIHKNICQNCLKKIFEIGNMMKKEFQTS